MYRKACLTVVIAFAAAVGPQRADAQNDASEAAAYTALHLTSVAGVPPITPNLGRQALAIRGHYGRHEFGGESSNAFAAGVDFGILPRHSAGVTVGYFDPTAGDGHVFFGAQVAGNLIGLWTPPGEGQSIAVTYEIQGGYAQADDVDLLAFSAGAPIAFPFRGRTISVIPFITPAIGFGRMSFEGTSESGIRPLLSGGAGLEFANGLGVHLGARYVFVDQADLLWGLGLSWRAR